MLADGLPWIEDVQRQREARVLGHHAAAVAEEVEGSAAVLIVSGVGTTVERRSSWVVVLGVIVGGLGAVGMGEFAVLGAVAVDRRRPMPLREQQPPDEGQATDERQGLGATKHHRVHL